MKKFLENHVEDSEQAKIQSFLNRDPGRPMNERQEKAAAKMLMILADLPWQERADVFRAVECNDSICVRCGYATEQFGCQCQNDE